METTEMTRRQGSVRSPSRPRTMARRLWVGAVVCAATLAGVVALHGAIDHGNKRLPTETVTTMNQVGHRVDGSIGPVDGSSEDPRRIRPPGPVTNL